MFCSFGQKSRTPTQPPLNHPVQKQMQAPKIIPINRLFHRPWPSRAIFQKMMFWPLVKNQGQVHSEPHALLPRNKELTRKNHGLGLGFSLGPGPVSGFFKSHDHQLFHRLHQLLFSGWLVSLICKTPPEPPSTETDEKQIQAHKSLKSIGFFLYLGPVEPFSKK